METDYNEDDLYPDNVYAEAVTGTKRKKGMMDAEAQVIPSALMQGEYLEMDDEEIGRRRQRKKQRGRKNKYYSQIDAEDDEEAGADQNGFEDSDLEKINEDDEIENEKKKKKKEEDLKAKQVLE